MKSKKPTLKEQLANALERVKSLEIEVATLSQADYSLRLSLKSISGDNEDLKQRLLNAQLENAKNIGYLQRVREDDNVNDPVVEIEDANGKRIISKRFPMRQSPQYFPYSDEKEKFETRDKKHWVNY